MNPVTAVWDIKTADHKGGEMQLNLPFPRQPQDSKAMLRATLTVEIHGIDTELNVKRAAFRKLLDEITDLELERSNLLVKFIDAGGQLFDSTV